MTITMGLDLGNGAVKAVLVAVEEGIPRPLARHAERLRRRAPQRLAADVFAHVLEQAGLTAGDLDYVATTGDGAEVSFATGHFFSMTAHARGAVWLEPTARTVLDVGALHGRAMAIDGRGKVLAHRMTSQCASGSGQFLENIARYLGISQDEIGPLSLSAPEAQPVGGVCAVLAETDVINMVSRQVPIPNILRGIHLSMARRLARLVDAVRVDGEPPGEVLVTGGLGHDIGLLAALNGVMEEREVKAAARSHPDSIFAGAVGASLWGAYRHDKLDWCRGGSVAPRKTTEEQEPGGVQWP